MEDLNLGEDNCVHALGKAENSASVTSRMEQLTQALDSSEVESTKKVGKCNLRKSLAWDAAFFTSAGVLDPDELSSMIGGGSSSKTQALPGIEEDIYRSTDSLSTYGSENLSLESLEGDLFQDIRASIQRSSKTSNRTKSNNDASGAARNQVILSIKEDLASKTVSKSSADLKKQTSLPTPGKLNVHSSNKPQGTSTRPIVGAGVRTPSLQKSTKASSRPTPGPSAAVGRSSMRANKVQLEIGKAEAIGKVGAAPKVPGSNGYNRTVARPVLPSKSAFSSASTATKKEILKLSSSSDSSTISTSVSSNRRKVAARSINNPTPSNSTPKTPSRVAMKKEEIDISASLRSSKTSSSISPASSISEWSVASSSSTSSVNQSADSVRTTGAGSIRKSRDIAAPLNDARRSTDRGLNKPENKVLRPNNEKPNAALTQRGAPPKPETAKPSGLRMPSPKIGFFDGVKSAARTPNGSSLSRSGIPSGPKVGPVVSTPIGVSSKATSPKLQTNKLVKPIGNIKLDSQSASTKVHGSPKNIETPLKLSPITHNETNETKFSISEEKGVGENCEIKGKETENISPVDVGEKMNANLVNLNIVSVDGDINDCKGEMAFEKENDIAELIFEKNSTSDLKRTVVLGEQMSDNLMNSKIVPNGNVCEGEEKMAPEEKIKDVENITEKLSAADLKNEMNSDEKLSACSVNVKIDLVDGEIYNCDGDKASKENNSDVTCFSDKISPDDVINDMDLEVKMSASSADTETVAVDGIMSDSVGKIPSEEMSNDVKSSTDKISLAGLERNLNLELKMCDISVKTETVPVNENISDCGEMASEKKSSDAISTNGKISPTGLESDIDLEVKVSANSVHDEIVLTEGDIIENMVYVENQEYSKSNTKNICSDHMICEINSDDASSSRLVNVNVDPANGEINDCKEKIASKEKGNDVKSIREELNPADLKSDMNSDENLSANVVNVNIDPAEGEICDYEGKPASGEKNNEVKSISENINPADVNNNMKLDSKMRPYSEYMKIAPVNEKSDDIKSSTEDISLADLKSDMNLVVEMIAKSGNMDIVPLDGDIFYCQEKMTIEKKSADIKPLDENISLDDLDCDMNLKVKMSGDLVVDKIVPEDGNSGGNVVCDEYADEAKLNMEKLDHGQVICKINSEEKGSANLANVDASLMDGDVYESGVVCQAKKDIGKSEIQQLINNWNSLHESAKKENQVGGFSSEHDLQKENAISSISSPKDLSQTDELLSKRTPFTERNTPCNDEKCDPSTELIAVGMEKITPSPSLECLQAEN